ncbi:MAG: nucleotidyl transferase AbiEii/AbiGii toxin family protein [Synergistaceae bacterium]|nr:nucleotidyl transferase AbiEii/AbiGii toxin family protein [Synergistaceae bacterium]
MSTYGHYQNLLLDRVSFERGTIEARMILGGFNSISRFELFLWDLEILLQLQKRLGSKIVLKGGAAAQFYIPIKAQRTSVDIDVICRASEMEVQDVLSEIEHSLGGTGEVFKFRKHMPQNPRIALSSLSTYFMTVPTTCTDKELIGRGAKQEVKLELLFVDEEYPINKIQSPQLFAVETDAIFNVLPFECLFADKLTTLGPNTIGIPDERSDEQFKQIYDLVTMFDANSGYTLEKVDAIKEHYQNAAHHECRLHSIAYDERHLLEDMSNIISKLRDIENDDQLTRIANDFQSLYIKRTQIRTKSDWATALTKLQLLTERIFENNRNIDMIEEIEELITKLQFNDIRGPERGKKIIAVKKALKIICNGIPNIRADLFNKKPERVIWELLLHKDMENITVALENILG